MAEPDKKQINEDLVSVQKILDTYRRNRRYLAEQQAELDGAGSILLRFLYSARPRCLPTLALRTQ